MTAEALRQIALERQWAYRERDRALEDRWCGAPFTQWTQSRALDAITGTRNGVPVAAFRFVVTHTDAYPEAFLVVAAALAGPLPRVSLVPLGNPVDVHPYGGSYEPEDAVLAEQYQITAVDLSAANALLHLTGVTILRRLPPSDWRIEGSDLLLIQRETDVTSVLDSVDALAEMAAAIPPEVYAEFVPVPTFPAPRSERQLPESV